MNEAIVYAKENGRAVPNALSNNFSLADMVNPVWEGCVAASGPDYRAWLAQNDIVNFAWSSQARGFFSDAAGEDKLDNAELVNSWYSPANFARRARALKLADEFGCSGMQIALAYILALDLPIVPLIGPRRLVELDDSLQALDISLTSEQVRWLETGE